MICQPATLRALDGVVLLASPPLQLFSVLVFVATFLFDFISNIPVPSSPRLQDEKLHFSIFLYYFSSIFFCLSVRLSVHMIMMLH
jgi:hypothetical protein